MAEKRISELTAKGSNLQSTDLLEVSVDAGGGSYVTRYITGAQITGAVSGANFANTNLTFTGNRTHTLAGYKVTLTGGDFEHLSGFASFGDTINTQAKLQGVTNTGGVIAIRGYHYGSGGRAGDFSADGANAQGINCRATGSGASAVKATGFYALDFDGMILDTPQATTPVMPQSNLAGEAALLATLTVGQWYYLLDGAGTAVVKVKV